MAEPFRASVDGGSRGNPGPAGWAVVVHDANGAPVEGVAGYLGRATNNVAEYTALLEALRLAAERGAEEVSVRADSELIVKQIHGAYKVRHPDLKPLWREAKERIGAFRTFRIEHVRREENREADRLVNRILNRFERGEDVAEPLRERLDAAALP
jgi:ribonuclease HI